MADMTPCAARAVAVVPDLFFQAKIREAAARAGVPVLFAGSEAALQEALSKGGVGVVIVSLESRSPDPFRAIAMAREGAGTRTVGFLNHVLEDLRKRALEAGCDEVLPKGAFARGLVSILREGAGRPAGPARLQEEP